MQLVRMNIVATRDLDDRTLSRQAFLNDPHLLSRCPPPAPLRAGKYRHSHRVCPLICKSMGKPVTSTLASAECRLPESLHFTECDVILGVVRARSVHKIGYG